VSTPALSLPSDIARTLAEMLAIDVEARHLVADLDDDQANWQPDDGRAWSIAQCFDHVAITTRSYVAPMTEAAVLARARGYERGGPIAPGLFGGWFARVMEPPPRQRVPAPQSIQPAARREKEEALEAFLAAQREVEDLLRASADIDTNVRFRNPFIPLVRFRLGAGFLITAAHARRHLWQARRVRESPAFPAS
jgi:hypothetical protein